MTTLLIDGLMDEATLLYEYERKCKQGEEPSGTILINLL